MQQYVRIYYNKIVEGGINGALSEELATDLAPFGRHETPYEPSCSYDENFERFMVDAYECGFVRISPERAVSVYQIKEFHAHTVAQKTPKAKNTIKQKPDDRPSRPVKCVKKPRRKNTPVLPSPEPPKGQGGKTVTKEIREGKASKGGVNKAPILPPPEPPKGQGGKTC